MQSQLSTAQREALARQDAPFLATGLIAGNPQSFEAHLRQAARLMAQTSASPSGRLVRHVTDLFERSVPESARAKLAGRRKYLRNRQSSVAQQARDRADPGAD